MNIVALYYSELVKIKATQYKISFTHHSEVAVSVKTENYETLKCSPKFRENRLYNAVNRRELHTE